MSEFDWFLSGPLTCDWDCHRARGSRGGEDRRHSAGSPVLLPWDASVSYGMYDDGASFVQFTYAHGWAHQLIHVQRDGRVPAGSHHPAGARVALSDGRPGTFGAGKSTGAHMHFQGHDQRGRRIPWQDVPPPPGVAALTAKPFVPPQEEEYFMSYSIVPVVNGGIDVLSLVTGDHIRIQNTYHVRLLQRARKNNSDDPMLDVELAIVGAYLTAINDIKVDGQQLADALAKIDIGTITPDEVKSAVTQALTDAARKIAS